MLDFGGIPTRAIFLGGNSLVVVGGACLRGGFFFDGLSADLRGSAEASILVALSLVLLLELGGGRFVFFLGFRKAAIFSSIALFDALSNFLACFLLIIFVSSAHSIWLIFSIDFKLASCSFVSKFDRSIFPSKSLRSASRSLAFLPY